MSIAIWLLGCLFWVPVIYLTFTAFWKTVRMFLVLILAGGFVFCTWAYFRDIAIFVTIAYAAGALVWPSWLAWDVYQTRNNDRHTIAQSADPPRLTAEDVKRRILGEM